MNLSGKWFNELGSSMDLNIVSKRVEGIYYTAVGDASGQYELLGEVDKDREDSQCMGFVVVWSNATGNSNSVTTWSGQAQMVGGEETIVTTWLLTSQTDANDDWHSTLIGKDVFSRKQPSDDQMKLHLEKGKKASFPTSLNR